MSRALSGLEIRGVDDLRRRLDPAVFSYANRIVLRRALYKLQRDARDRAPGKLFDNSIQSRPVPGTESGIVYSNAETAESIHEGRRPGEQVSIRKLHRYIDRYGLAGSVSVKTHRPMKPGKSAKAVKARDRAVISLAYRMQHAIAQSGTRPIPFLTEPLENFAAKDDLDRYWREALPKAFKKFGLEMR